jgi:hypothetical protein
MKKTIQRWEIAGAVFIIGFGSVMHFFFEWSGYWGPMSFFSPVNESTWEHFKMAFWPSVIWALIELPFIRKYTRNFAIAKAAGILAMPLIISALFYGYLAVIGEDILIADILLFIVAVIVGQWLSMYLLTRPAIEIPWLRGLALGVLAVMLVAFSLFTYFPPQNFIFEHIDSGQYGILLDYGQHDH